MIAGRTYKFILLAFISFCLATSQALPSLRGARTIEEYDECDQGNDDPFCASNDVTYLNLCEFQKALVKNAALKIVEQGVCYCEQKDKYYWDPRCVSDNQTYANNCEFSKARKKYPKLHILYLGLCKHMLDRKTITYRELQRVKLWRAFMPKDLYESLSNRELADVVSHSDARGKKRSKKPRKHPRRGKHFKND